MEASAARIAWLCTFLFSTVFVLGCEEDSGALFVDVRWQVKCPPGAVSCTQAQHQPRDIYTYTGGLTTETPAQAVAATCLVEPTDSGDVLWNFAVATPTYRLQIRNARVPREGGAVSGQSCTVEFVDAVNTYSGACGSAPLSAEQPCRLSSVGFAYEDRVNGVLGPTISTSLICEGVRAPSTPILARNLAAPDVRGESVNALAPINIVNCEGTPIN